ncbi:MAG: glycosyltransferase [Clostridia bacterium]|nr:glycosyltransferase [Clostridia bacterium]
MYYANLIAEIQKDTERLVYNMPRISIIMPVYNMEAYLPGTLGSWAAQTLEDIEVICVDDCSTDGSYALLQAWAQKDPRFIVRRFEQNQSAWMARKLGIQLARGEYIMFADADDEIAPQACEELYAQMQEQPVDILQFNTEIINVNGLPEKRIEAMQAFVTPYDGTLNGSEVFDGCFREKKYMFSLWNKIYSAELCRKAARDMEDAILPKAQDKLAYLILAYHARSYRGLPDKCYYKYYFGRGGTGFNRMTMKQFERYCTMARIVDGAKRFFESKGELEAYADVEETNRRQLMNDCLSRWLTEVPESDSVRAFDLMFDYWRADDIISVLAEKMYFDRYAVMKKILGANMLTYDRRPVKTVAAYYHSCVNGGVQRVLCQLCELWVKMGLNVVVLTDEQPEENDYPLPTCVKRVMLPHYMETNRHNYGDRCRAWQSIIREYDIDAVVYHAWTLNMMLWDEMAIKSGSAALIAHCHNVFSLSILRGWDSVRNMMAAYPLADGVVTLSGTDREFWSHYNANTYQTINPFTEEPGVWTPSACDTHDILWLARISYEKHPFDALHIIRRVAEAVPDVKLHIVGDAKEDKIREDFHNEIERMELEEHVVLHGFQRDVKPYYSNASVFLMTSEYEGYPLTLQESKMAGLPCVMYELPYLTLAEDGRGIISVPQGNISMAAQALIELLTNDEMRKEYGRAARRHVEELFGFDFDKLWTEIFESLTRERVPISYGCSYRMLETLIDHHEMNHKREKKKISLLEKRIDERQKKYDDEREKSTYLRKKVAYLRNKAEKQEKTAIVNPGKLVRAAVLVEKGFHVFREKGAVYAIRRAMSRIRRCIIRK